MKLKFLGFALLWCLVSAVAMAEDFSSQLEKLGIPKEKIEGLLKDGIDSCNIIKELDIADLKKTGLTTGQSVKLKQLCTPPLPKTLVECSTRLDEKS